MRLIDADALLETIGNTWEYANPMTIIDLIASAPTVQREGWISVKDRVPAERSFASENLTFSEKVIVFNSDGVNIQRFVNGDCFGSPTPWQPMQNPPKD